MSSPDEKFTRRFVKARLREIEEQAKQLQATAEAALKEIANLDRIRILRWMKREAAGGYGSLRSY